MGTFTREQTEEIASEIAKSYFLVPKQFAYGLLAATAVTSVSAAWATIQLTLKGTLVKQTETEVLEIKKQAEASLGEARAAATLANSGAREVQAAQKRILEGTAGPVKVNGDLTVEGSLTLTSEDRPIFRVFRNGDKLVQLQMHSIHKEDAPGDKYVELRVEEQTGGLIIWNRDAKANSRETARITGTEITATEVSASRVNSPSIQVYDWRKYKNSLDGQKVELSPTEIKNYDKGWKKNLLD